MDKDRVFRVATLPSEHVFKMNVSSDGEITPLGGVEFRFLSLLAECMNFKFRVFVPPDGEFGRKREDGEWTGMVGMAKRGEVDFGLNMIALTYVRNEAVNFSYPYMIDGTTFITEVPATLHKTFAYFYPFDGIVWLGLIIVLMIAPFAFKYLLMKSKSISILYLDTFGYFFQQPIMNLELSKLSQNIFCVAWLFYVRLTTLCYSVVLLSFLTIPLMSQGLYSVRQVAQAVAKGTHECYLFGGTADQDAFYSATEGSLYIIGRTIKKNNRLVKHGGHVKEYIPNSKTVLIGSNVLVPFNYMDGVYQKYYLSKDFFYNTFFAIPIQENFCCLEQMNKCIFRTYAAGLYEKFMKDEVYFIDTKSHFQQEVEEKTIILGLDDLSGAFVILLGGYVLAGITLCFERHCCKNKSKSTIIF